MSTINIGIIGAGRIGRIHAENVTRSRMAHVKSVSDISVERAAAMAKELGIANFSDDYREMLHDPDIQAVFICSSTDTHAAIIHEAAEAKKHIFCEKPVSLNLRDTVDAVEAADRYGVKLQIGFNRRFDANFARAQQLTREGRIGDLHMIRIVSRDPEPPPSDYIASSGGLFLDMAIHDFDMARFLSGSEVEEVYASGAALIDAEFAKWNDVDTAVTVLKMTCGAFVVVENSRKAAYGYDQRVEVFGSEGKVTVANEYPNSAVVSTADGVYRDLPLYFFLERYRESFALETEQFIQAIAHDEEVKVSGIDSLEAERIAHAAKRSYEENRSVRMEEMKKEELLWKRSV